LKHIIFIFGLMLTLASCSTTKSVTTGSTTAPKETWATREAALSQIKSWQINGKIAVQNTKDAGSASLDWFQSSQRYIISLQGPLGSHAMKLTGSPGQVTLQTSDGKSYRAASAEQLLAKQWGFHLPVSNMNYWVRGLPVPNVAANTHFDDAGRLSTLVQQGYRVEFLSYTNTGRWSLPDKISITSPDIHVKMIVYRWNAG